MTEPAPGYVTILVERPKHPALASAARALAAGESPVRSMERYPREFLDGRLVIDDEFGAVPIGPGGSGGDREILPQALDPERSEKFLVRAFYRADSLAEVPERIDDGIVYADPAIRGQLTCGSSRPVGGTYDVRQKLDTATLASHGLDGTGVAIAVCDSGIYLPHLTKRLGAAPALDETLSWKPPGLKTKPGMNRIGHGTMCAYGALVAAPKATLLDIPILRARTPGDHSARGTIGAAMQGYWYLISNWAFGKPKYVALVVSNSWGILHPSLDFPPGHLWRFIDNPNHIFRLYIRVLTLIGVDIVFATSNCGPECPSAVCLGKSQGMIMGANAYTEVLTLAGCDATDARVGYSSRGPSIPGMPQQKPDLTAYTHFLGSRTYRSFLPDTGTSTACAVAAGCVAALRTLLSSGAKPPGDLADTFRATAHKGGAPGWDADVGHGVIRPVAVGRSLGLIP